MSKKILFVDDEPNVLQSIRRSLRKQFDIDTAEGGEEALQKMSANGSYAIIVSDMRMPGMDGVQLLSAAKQKWPDTVRMMLTGNADQQTAVDAVNKGDVFRFLNKPCEAEELASVITTGLRQYELITAEKQLLEQTLRGSIKALAEVLSLTNPEVFGRTARYKNRVGELAAALDAEDAWQLESAAMLSHIGCMTVPADLVSRKLRGERLEDDDLAEYATHAAVGADLLSAIPRLEGVAEAVRYQEKGYDGSGYPRDGVQGDKIPLGARLLRIVADFEAIDDEESNPRVSLGKLKQNAQCYDPDVLTAFESIVVGATDRATETVGIHQLTDSMILAQDVYTSDNILLITKGHEMTLSARRHLQNYLSNGMIGDSVVVWRQGR